jgi:phosphate:Na+ symporter
MDFTNWSMLIAGIWLFLFGMMFFEETIHEAFGNGIKSTIQKYAGSLFQTIGIGTFATAILQSSTVVTMIMLWFVWAGLLNLQQGIGIILWANIGTTLTPWLIWLIGFKMNIESITLPVIALGGILLVIGSSNKKILLLSKFLLWFGLLFLGLGYMKESVDVLSQSFTFWANIWLRQSILMGIVITLVLQTSTGASVITLTALSSGMISFDIALWVMIGANIGTALSTFAVSFLSTTGKHHLKKMIALSHVLFNLITATVVIIILQPIHRLLTWTQLDADPVIGIAAFHTLFNIIGAILFVPIVKPYIKQIHRLWWTQHEDENRLAISQISTSLPEELIVAMNKDIVYVGSQITLYIQELSKKDANQSKLIDIYTNTKEDIAEWLNIAFAYDTKWCTKQQQDTIIQYQDTMAELLTTFKHLKDISFHFEALHLVDNEAIEHYIDQFSEKLEDLTHIMVGTLQHPHSRTIDHNLDKLEHEITLDDTRFLSDIRASIVRHHEQSDQHHYRSQLIKLNRYIILIQQSALAALQHYHKA